MTRLTAIALLLASCAHRICGALDPEAVVAFHESHSLSIGANPSSVGGLAVGDDAADGGAVLWEVCVEGDRAEIQNHATAWERAEGYGPLLDGGR